MRKLLNDLGLKDKDLPWNWNKGDTRQEEWKKERKEYGFDERDTWNLNFTLPLLVYERLKWYRMHAPIDMDSDYPSNVYEFRGEQVMFGKSIDRILKSFETKLKKDDVKMTDEEYEEYQICWELLGVIMPGLWW